MYKIIDFSEEGTFLNNATETISAGMKCTIDSLVNGWLIILILFLKLLKMNFSSCEPPVV